MATITVTKEKAIKRILSKIKEGENLNDLFQHNISHEVLENILEDYDIWKSSTINTLTQIFTNETFAKNILSQQDPILGKEQNLITEVKELKSAIKMDIANLKNVIQDLNENIYLQEGQQNIRIARISLWQTIIVALITALGGIIAGYIAIPRDADPKSKQGLENLTLEGKWKYICTSFDGSYQHGGRFVVQKEKNGALLLNGERMWKDVKDSTGTWQRQNFKESDYLQWHTNYIFVLNDSQLYFEYRIPTQVNDLIGYCSSIINTEKGKVVCAKGNFYVLNQNPILTGQIIFKKVSDKEYYLTNTLPKNH